MFGILGAKKRRYSKRQRGRGIPFGLIASAAAPFLGEVAKPLLKKKKLVVGIGEDGNETKKYSLVVVLFPNESDCSTVHLSWIGMRE